MLDRVRSVRDWLVDAGWFALALVGGLVALEAFRGNLIEPFTDREVTTDYALGAACCLALWFRRRWPLGVAVAMLVPAVLSFSGAIAILVAIFTVGVYRRAGIAIAVTLAHLVAATGFSYLHPTRDALWEWALVNLAVYAAVIAWAFFLGARRQLVLSLRERAERAEAEQQMLAEQARRAERARIAREMHDVLGHRVSLIALHAGGLEIQPDVRPEVVQTAGVIRAAARQALEELRQVIGVLRDDADGNEQGGPPAPLPTLSDIPRLVEESRRAGANVRLDMEVPHDAPTPGTLGRDAYRIVQEGLTNVHKHVVGAAITVTVQGGPGAGLNVRISNPLPRAGFAPRAGGRGLVGLAERVELSGGTLTHGPNDAGEFVLDAVLRWPT
ncbi:MAG: histidine kinase [Chloroflexota bacterium]|nr:histidine kinase [Chloroflexota bacterium]